jgi:hypothetical protein
MAQPAWFGAFSVEAEREDPDSTLNFYRRALQLRRELLAPGGQLAALLDPAAGFAAAGSPGGAPEPPGGPSESGSPERINAVGTSGLAGGAGGPVPVGASGDSEFPAALGGMVWLAAPAGALRFARGGWQCVANFAAEPFDLPDAEVLLTSGPLVGGRLGEATCAWLRARA